jgi:aryl-alcohol dehydrogenase-like predicted oxidoreductase
MLMETLKSRCTTDSFSCDLYPLTSRFLRGRVLKELGYKRSDLVISTKIFWGPRTTPNDTGLSRKQCDYRVLS